MSNLFDKEPEGARPEIRKAIADAEDRRDAHLAASRAAREQPSLNSPDIREAFGEKAARTARLNELRRAHQKELAELHDQQKRDRLSLEAQLAATEQRERTALIAEHQLELRALTTELANPK